MKKKFVSVAVQIGISKGVKGVCSSGNLSVALTFGCAACLKSYFRLQHELLVRLVLRLVMVRVRQLV